MLSRFIELPNQRPPEKNLPQSYLSDGLFGFVWRLKLKTEADSRNFLLDFCQFGRVGHLKSDFDKILARLALQSGT